MHASERLEIGLLWGCGVDLEVSKFWKVVALVGGWNFEGSEHWKL